MRSAISWILLLAALAGCSAEKEKPRQLTERERNEAIARSVLPGAAVVGRALTVSDSAASRAQRMQTQVDPNNPTP